MKRIVVTLLVIATVLAVACIGVGCSDENTSAAEATLPAGVRTYSADGTSKNDPAATDGQNQGSDGEGDEEAQETSKIDVPDAGTSEAKSTGGQSGQATSAGKSTTGTKSTTGAKATTAAKATTVAKKSSAPAATFTNKPSSPTYSGGDIEGININVKLKFLSYNIESSISSVKEETPSWRQTVENKAKKLAKVIGSEDPDIYTVQGCLDITRNILESTIKGYELAASMDGASNSGSFMYYKSDEFSLLESGTVSADGSFNSDGAQLGLYSVLREKITGKTFAHVSMNIDTEDTDLLRNITAKVSQAFAERDITVFLTGGYTNVSFETIFNEIKSKVDNFIDMIAAGDFSADFSYSKGKAFFSFVSEGIDMKVSFRAIGDYTIADRLGLVLNAEL